MKGWWNILENWKILTGKLTTPTNSLIVIYKLGNVATELSIYLTSLTAECRIVFSKLVSPCCDNKIMEKPVSTWVYSYTSRRTGNCHLYRSTYGKSPKLSQSWNISPERKDTCTLTKTKGSKKSGKNTCTMYLVIRTEELWVPGDPVIYIPGCQEFGRASE